MVVGVLGEVVVHHVVLEYRREHAQILHQHTEDLSVWDLQVKLVPHYVLAWTWFFVM